jgi:hypothetical protein
MNQSSKKALKPALKVSINRPSRPRPRRRARQNNNSDQITSTNQMKNQLVSRSAPLSQGYIRPIAKFGTMAPSKPGSEFRVVGCDYVGSVSSSATLGVDNSFPINPLSAVTFPRLSAISTVFGKYSFNKIRFIVVGKAAATVAGDMTSVISYGSLAFALTEAQIKNRVGQVTSKFWENHYMDGDPRKSTVPWFIMSVTESQVDIFGIYHLFTETTGAVVGIVPVADIFVEYDIEYCEALAIGDLDP